MEMVVVFQLGNESYGIDISRVQEIRVMSEITALPGVPEYVDGVINLRGRITPVVDMHARFDQARKQATKDTRIIVVSVAEEWVGLIVDGVSEVMRVAQESFEPPSGLIADGGADCISGIAKVEESRLVILLDLDRMLAATTLAAALAA